MTQNLLHISPDFNYSCGVSKHVYLLLKELHKNKTYDIFFITNKGDSLERLTKLGIQATIVDFSRGSRNVYKLMKDVLFIYKFCKQNNINVIHTHHRYPELVAYLVSKILPIKTISTVHSLLTNLKLFSFRSEKIIAVSNAVKENLIKNYKINPDRINVLYNYVEPFIEVNQEQKDKFLLEHNISESDRILLFVGRISEIKGCDVLLSAFDEIKEVKKNIRLILVGSWELPLTYKINTTDNSKILIIKSSDEISMFYSVSALVVAPSRNDSFPFIMLEAGLAKKPFIGGRTGGIAEFIEDDVDGLLVEPGNKYDLQEKIVKLLDDKILSLKLANHLYNKVAKLTNPDSYISQLMDIYERKAKQSI